MNRKELVQRWRNALGYGQKEVFYYPVKDNKPKGDFSPMILEIEVSVEEGKVKCEFSSYNNNCSINIFNVDNNGVINNTIAFPIARPFYNLKTSNGKKLSLQDFKNVLKDTYSLEYNVYEHVQLLYEENEPFLKIDWGDGNIVDYSNQLAVSTQTVTINNITYSYDYINSTGRKSHTYTKSGRYIVKINANLPSLYGLHKMNTASNTPYCDIKKLIKWGNLHLRISSSMFLDADSYEYIQPLSELTNDELYYVLKCDFMFCDIKYDIQNIVGDNLKTLPNLIYASQMFCNCSFKKIPRKFLQYNTKLQYIDGIFEKNYLLVSVEEEVFSNLLFLTSAIRCFYECNYLQTVGNMLFENDVNLVQISWAFFNCFNLNTVGNGLFKNCFSLQAAENSFSYCSRLKTVGQYLFENCYTLKSVYFLFDSCISLETIGDDLFKNCYNINNAGGLFHNCMKVTVPDRLFYYLKCNETNYNLLGYHDDCKKYQRLLCKSMFGSDVVYIENLVSPEENNIVIGSYSTLCPDDDLRSEYYSYTFETFPYITLGKEMFSPQFISDLKKYNAVIDIDGFRLMTRRELHKTESYYDYDTDYGTSMSLGGSIYTTSVKGEAFPIWENPEAFYYNYDGVYGFTEESLLYNNYSYSKNDIFHITSSLYYIGHKPKFDNVASIPLPKLYTYDHDDNNKTYHVYPYGMTDNEFNYLSLCHQLIIENTKFKETKWSCEFEEVEYNS